MVLLRRGDAIKPRITSRNKILATLSTGIMFLIVPVLITIIDPIQLIINYKLRLAKGTILHELLQHEILAARLSVYVFNISNAERFLSGEDYKIKVDEVGPFIFHEYRWYEDLEFSEDGSQVAATPKIRSEFILEDSIGHPKDINLTLPNLPFLSAVSILSNYPNFVQYAFNIMASQIGAKPTINLDVERYLWGYKNPLVTFCNNLAPGLVYFESFGLLDRLYDNDSNFRIVMGATNADRFKILSVKKTRLIQKGSQDIDETVQTFDRDTYEGGGFPPMLTPEVPINLYRLGICKTFNMEWTGTRNMEYGGEGMVYIIGNKTFLDSDGDPISKKPYPPGVLGISKCYYGLPFVVSKAHFLDADPKLLERIDGLKPDRKKYINEIVVDRKVSVTYNTKVALQLSMVVDDLSSNRLTRKISNSVIPVVHVTLEQPKMSESTMRKFILVYQVAPNVVLCVQILSVLIGLTAIGYALRLSYHNCISKTNEMVFQSMVDKKIRKVEEPQVLRVLINNEK